jgi:xanthine dehydrogenase molybdopterin-binding subunit B
MMMADPPSLRSYNHCVVHGNVDSAMAAAPRTLTGEGRVGAQEHFYLEPHVVMAAPEEHRGEMTIYSCTQCVAKTVKIVAGCLGVQENKVNPLPPTAPTPSLNSLLTQLSAPLLIV